MRAPLAEVWSIAWPTVLTMASYTLMQFVDALMVGQVGPLEVAAQGNASIWVLTPVTMGMGILTVVNTFVSQNLGAGTAERGPRYAWAGVWMSVAMWVFILLPMAVFVPEFFAFLHDPASVRDLDHLIALEIGYGRILLVGGVLALASRALHHFFFGLHRPKIITVSSLIANTVNALANYVFIFGERGIPALGLPGVPGVPALGLVGAGIGTVIGSAVELAIPAAVFLGGPLNARLRTRAAWRPSPAAIRDLFRIGWAAGVPHGNDVLCWAIFMTVLVGQFGETHMTAAWIAWRYLALSFMPAVGFSVAVTSLVARYIGAGQPDVALARARLGLGMAAAYMTTCGLLFIALRHSLIGAFVGGDQMTADTASRIIEIGGHLMICAAIFQTLDAVHIVYGGALRGAGDTVWPGLVTIVLGWLLLIGGSLLLSRAFPEWGSVGPWIGAAIYIIVLGLALAARFESGRWRSIDLLEGRAQPPPIAPLVAGPGAETSARPDAINR